VRADRARRTRSARGRRVLVAFLPALLWASPAAADAWEPEFNVSPEAGGGFVLDDEGVVGEGIAWLALGTDVNLFRTISRQPGLGFNVRFGTRDFGDFVFLGGVQGVFPVHEAFPIILSAGAGIDMLTGESLWYGRFWWGARSHNRYNLYAMAFGIFVEYQRSIRGDDEPMLLFGASVDGYVLCWPFMWLYEWATVDQGPEVV
jgi:hypothetical protein